MNHDRAKRLLAGYADGQTGSIQRFLLRRHVARCPSCLAELDTIQAMRTALRTNLPMHRAPPALAMRISSALPREAPPATHRRLFHLGFAGRTMPGRAMAGGLTAGTAMVGTALAGAIAGMALTVTFTRFTQLPDPVVAEVVADHVRSLMADHLTDVATSDQHVVKPWLSARLDLSPLVKELAAEGFPLVGGRLDYVDGHAAAAIVYRRDRHVINLFAYVSDDRLDTAPQRDFRNGFNIVRWRMGGLTYIAVSDVEAAQLLAFVRLLEVG
jgi:anti-sigma factor RsiW